MPFKAKFLATGIGSMPFDNADHAVDISLQHMSECPIWPQLPKFGFHEQMEIQYSEGMPCTVIDNEKNRMYFDTGGDYSEAFAEFYEKYLSATEGGGDCAAMAISPSFSKGINAFESRLKQTDSTLPFIKVQVIGPCSFALTIVDENKRAIFYNEEFRDMIVKAIVMKARWQIQKFKPFSTQGCICFIDEPILSAFGSSTYVSVTREDIVALLSEVIEAIRMDGGISGIHCCGNTEWSIPVDAGVDIINFDAFDFGETIAMYADAVKKHLARGGLLAWGIIPTNIKIREHSVESLCAKLELVMDNLSSKGIDKKVICEQAIITPSCGTGSMECADAEKVFSMLSAVSETMRVKYFS